MKTIDLLPHNEKAYKKLVDALSNSQLTAINHATGTGKSFIILKYLYENRDKRILYLTPTYPIFDQLVNEHMKDLNIDISEFNKLDHIIYANMPATNPEKLAQDYDIIILDEYHRIGARKWGKNVFELLDIIKEKYKGTKVIGTTATEVRYLDGARNMNVELLDNNTCSTLTVKDAILDGILPLPRYINYDYDLLESVNRIRRRIQRLVHDKNEAEYILRKLNELETELGNIIDSEIRGKLIDVNSKSIGFVDSISNFESAQETIKKFIPGFSKFYSVSSYFIDPNGKKKNIKREENQREISEFTKATKDISSVLLSVNILNEGLHVKDVDNLFMLRKTKSPIIFFQQLGRILSCSARDKEVTVFDLVNNIEAYPVIIEIFSSIVSDAKKRLIEDPENRDRYNKIIRDFSFQDLSLNLAKEVRNLEEKYSRIGIGILNLNHLIDLLVEVDMRNNGEVSSQSKILMEEIKASSIYFTVDSLRRYLEIPCVKGVSPIGLKPDEYEKYLGGLSCISKKRQMSNNESYERIKEFIIEHGRIPDYKNPDESEIVSLLFKFYKHYSVQKKEFISNYINDLDELESLVLEDNENVDIVKLIENIKIAMENNVDIPSAVSMLIYYSDLDNRREIIDIINDYRDKQESMIEEQKVNISDVYRADMRAFILESYDRIHEIGIDSFIMNLYVDYKKYIEEFKTAPQYMVPKNNDIESLKQEAKRITNLFFGYIVFNDELEKRGLVQELEELKIKCEMDKVQVTFAEEIVKIINFIETSGGFLPSPKSPDPDEVALSKVFKKNYDKYPEELRDEIVSVLANYRSHIKARYDEYINFLETHKRRPVDVEFDDNYEYDLYMDSLRFSTVISKEDAANLNKKVRQYANFGAEVRFKISIEDRKKGL